MRAILCLSAGILSLFVGGVCFGASVSQGKCPGNRKDYSYRNIVTSIKDNYNESGQTACVARNLNTHNVHVVYDVYPTGNDAKNPTHANVDLTLHISEEQMFFSNGDNDPHKIQCNLVSSCAQ
jgi:hypothetical protein